MSHVGGLCEIQGQKDMLYYLDLKVQRRDATSLTVSNSLSEQRE